MHSNLRVIALFSVWLCGMSGLGGQDSMGRTEHYFPQVVVGGGSTSVFVIYNPNAEAVSVDLRVWRSNGILYSTVRVDVVAGGTSTVTAGGTTGTLTVGWAELTATQPFEVTEFFQIQLGEEALPRVGVLSSEPSQILRLFCFAGEGVRTGVAVANLGETTANLTLRRFDDAGLQVEMKQTQLGGHNQLAKFLDESPYFPGLTECNGSVQIEASTPVVAVTLRTDDNLLATAPVLTPETLAAGSVGTEQLVDGAVASAKILDGTIVAEDLAAGSVTSAKILNGTIATEDLAPGSVNQGKLGVGGPGAVPGQVLGTDGTQLRWQEDSLKLPVELNTDEGTVALAVSLGPEHFAFGRAVISAYGSKPANGLVAYGKGSYAGVFGGSTDSGTGVIGSSESGEGVVGASRTGSGVRGEGGLGGDGLVGKARANLKSGVYAFTIHAGGYAGYFVGQVHVQGNITTSGTKPFKIDHPLDPKNRYLMHAAVESDEVLNTYSGNVVLDHRGEAVVGLSDWFETLNTDFRYALTAVGAPGPGLYVAEKVNGNRFRIAGGTPGGEVSWQITARRNDPGMQLRPFHAEVEKTAEERGTYLDPEAYGQPPEKGYDRLREGTAGVDGGRQTHPEFVPPPIQVTRQE